MIDINKIIEKALTEINQFQDQDSQLDIFFKGLFIGPNGKLDSLSTATFLIELENILLNETGKKIDITQLFLTDEGLDKDYTLEDIANIIKNEF